MAVRMRIAAMLISQCLSHSLERFESMEMCFEILNVFADGGVLIDPPLILPHNSKASVLSC
jgi:hypothetical protein